MKNNLNLQNQINQIEKEFIKIIIENLDNGLLKLDEAKNNAREFLSLLPFSSFDDLKKKIQEFVSKHPLYQKTYLLILKNEEEIKTQQLLEKMRSFINENKFEEAIKVIDNNNE